MAAERNPEQTRKTLLLAAFQEIHRNGFKRASLDTILANTGLTKGALYHHFPNKQALGYAVVDEVLRTMVYERFLSRVEGADDPVGAIQEALRQSAENMVQDMIQYGCPLNNLAQEMSSLDEGFRQRLDQVFRFWRDGFAQALERGIGNGTVRTDIDVQQAATFILAAVEGCIGMAKNAQSTDVLRQCGMEILRYLETLRAAR